MTERRERGTVTREQLQKALDDTADIQGPYGHAEFFKGENLEAFVRALGLTIIDSEPVRQCDCPYAKDAYLEELDGFRCRKTGLTQPTRCNLKGNQVV